MNSEDSAKMFVDAAKRANDIVNTYIAGMSFDELKTKYIAIRLSDGGSDGQLYDTKRDAVRAQLSEQQCAYVALRNLAGGSTVREMAIYLQFNRDAYDAGLRLSDPDDVQGGQEAIATAARVDELRQRINRRLRKTRIAGLN